MSSSFSLFDPAVRADPYPYYAALREEAAVAEIKPMGFLVPRLARLERCESEITWTDSPFVRGPKQLLLG